MSKPTRRQGSAVYYARRVIPKDLKEALGRREIWKSLDEVDLERAKPLERRQQVVWDDLFDSLRRDREMARRGPTRSVASSSGHAALAHGRGNPSRRRLDPLNIPTTAMRQVKKGATDADIRRFQEKWREGGKALLAEAQTAPIASTGDERPRWSRRPASPTMINEVARALDAYHGIATYQKATDYVTSAAIQTVTEYANSTACKTATDYATNVAIQAATEYANSTAYRVATDYVTSTAFAAERELQKTLAMTRAIDQQTRVARQYEEMLRRETDLRRLLGRGY